VEGLNRALNIRTRLQGAVRGGGGGTGTGQLSRLIWRETGFRIGRSVLRYDGLPFTPESILREIDR